MADRVSATIIIGGTMSVATFALLSRVIVDEDLSTDWEGTRFTGTDMPQGEPLSLFATEVAWGRFEELENYCARTGIPFRRWSGGCGGSFGPERAVFTGSGDIQLFVVDEDDEVVIGRGTVEKLGSIAAILGHFDAADFVVPPLIVRA
jgi:hypothetical protein